MSTQAAGPEASPSAPLDRNKVRRAGFVAMAVSTALMWLLSSMFEAVVFPPAALADLIVRSVPGGFSTFFIDALGHWALRLLFAGVLAGSLLLGGELLWRRSKSGAGSAGPQDKSGAGSAGPQDKSGAGSARPEDKWYRLRSLETGGLIAALGLVASIASTSGTGNLILTAGALVVSAFAYAVVSESVYATATNGADESRRRALRLGFGGAMTIALAGGALGWVARAFSGPDRNVRLSAPVDREALPSRGEDWPDIEGLPPDVTSAADHYVVDVNLIKPSVDAGDWELRVFGEVDNELTFDFAGLQRSFEVVEEYSVLTCISNEVGGNLIGTSLWGGVRLRDVLEEVGVRDGVVDLVLRGAEGYSDSIPLDVAMDEHVLVAISQNGEPLTQAHGFPARLRIPAIYGMKNVKWLESIELVTNDYQGYWMDRGWSDEAVVKTESRIDVIGDEGSAMVGEPVWIAGIAWAGARGISRVEVSTDAGTTWEEAQLKNAINERTWRFWAYRWTPTEVGDVEIVCRATDGDGSVQTQKVAEPHPSGASGYPSRTAAVRSA